MNGRTANRRFLVAVATLAAACAQRDGILGKLGNGPSSDGGSGSRCPAGSPQVTVLQQSTCTGRLAASYFSNALCLCNDLRLANSLTTDGFQSSRGPYKPNQLNNGGAAVGVNGTYGQTAGSTNVAGSFTVAGPGAVQFVGSLLVRGDLRMAGPVTAAGVTTVLRDAWLAGNFTGIGALLVTGNLFHAGSVSATFSSVSPANDHQQAVNLAPPCPCAASEQLDVAGLVANARTANDDAAAGIKPDVLASIAGRRDWTLPCGRIYLSQIVGNGDVTVHVSGPSALFIDGSINLQGSLTFQLESGAEIDVFVRQDLLVQGPLALADKSQPAAGRISVGGFLPIALTSPFVGNLYAPSALVTATGDIEVWGAIFASGFQGSASATVTFDRDIVTVGQNCTAPPASTRHVQPLLLVLRGQGLHRGRVQRLPDGQRLLQPRRLHERNLRSPGQVNDGTCSRSTSMASWSGKPMVLAPCRPSMTPTTG